MTLQAPIVLGVAAIGAAAYLLRNAGAKVAEGAKSAAKFIEDKAPESALALDTGLDPMTDWGKLRARWVSPRNGESIDQLTSLSSTIPVQFTLRWDGPPMKTVVVVVVSVVIGSELREWGTTIPLDLPGEGVEMLYTRNVEANPGYWGTFTSLTAFISGSVGGAGGKLGTLKGGIPIQPPVQFQIT